MQSVRYEISKEDFEKYREMGNAFSGWYGENKVSDSVRMGYGYYGAFLEEGDGKYYVVVRMGNSCD